MVINALGFFERQQVMGIFGAAKEPDSALNGPPARPCLTVGAVRQKLKENRKTKYPNLARHIQKWDAETAMEKHEAKLFRDAEMMNEVRKKRA